MKKFLFSVFLLTSIFLTIAFFLFFWYPNQIGSNQDLIEITIERGSSASKIADQLAKARVIKHPHMFTSLAYAGRAMNGRALKAGDYAFKPSMKAKDVYNMIASGKVVRYSITIPEGWTNTQIFERVKNKKDLSGDLPPMLSEGSYYPDTYFHSKGESRTKLLKRMSDKNTKILKEIWDNRSVKIKGVDTAQDMLILASIVEKETGYKAERERVASVFANRLKIGMKLQSDPTTIYAVTKGKYILGRGLRRSELNMKSPFNTYYAHGLTPTPICNPGRKALEAVANPETTDYLFFVANTKGGHWFAKTLAQHNKNVAKYRRLLAN